MFKKRHSPKRIVFFLFLAFALLITSISSAYNLFSPEQNSHHISTSQIAKQEKVIPSQNPLKNKINILLLGVDQRSYDKGRSDTLILLTLNPLNKSMHFLSIPRDSRVNIPDYGIDKINAAYAYGGAQLTKQAVERLLNIKVDYYLQLNYQALVQIVDILGGIDIDVEKPMYYADSQDGLLIDLQSGKQHLNGKQVMGYVRFRHDGLGDIGRISRQQNFLNAALNQALQYNNLPKIPFILQKIGNNISTDMPLATLLALGKMCYQNKDKTIEMATLPGEGIYIDGISYWVLDEEKTAQLSKNYQTN